MTEINVEEIDKEVLPLLSLSAKPQVRCVAMQMFLGLTGTPEGVNFITSNDTYMTAISEITQDKQEAIAKDAFCALINLAAEEPTAWRILNLSSPENFTLYLLEYVLRTSSLYADMVCSLLSNLTRSERCAQKVVDVMVKEKDKVGFSQIVHVFCQDDYNKKNNLHYLGPFLANLTQVKEARKYVLDKERCVVQRLLPYTEYKRSLTRRGGIMAVLRNCCFETEYHEWLLGDKVDILPRLLLPLAGPEEFDDDDNNKLPEDLQYLEPEKERESDPDIRCMLVECINKLCSTKICRKYVKDKNTYVILRELFNWEKSPTVKLAAENLIALLIGDEPEPSMEDLTEVEIPADIQAKLEKTTELLRQEALQEEANEAHS